MQGAPFLGFVQIIVYTGAIMMLFLFVLMLVGVGTPPTRWSRRCGGQRVGRRRWPASACWCCSSLTVGHAALGSRPPACRRPALGGGNVNGIAALLFTNYLFPFEVTSALLITAAVGAMVLAHRERASGEKQTQRRAGPGSGCASGRLSPLPGPGVLRHGTTRCDMPGPAARTAPPAEVSVSARHRPADRRGAGRGQPGPRTLPVPARRRPAGDDPRGRRSPGR